MISRPRACALVALFVAILLPTLGAVRATTAQADAALPDLAGLTGPGEGAELADWAREWIDGPVGVIATDEERELFGSLETTGERLQFIRLFWERRDPERFGERNEFLDEFARRVAYVREEFGDGGAGGWDTVFGRVVLTLGVPDRQRRELTVEGVSDRPPILWSYDEAIPGLDGNEDLMFVFRAGRWRLYPPSGFGDSGVAEQMRQIERQSLLVEVPTEYEEAMAETVDGTLVNTVDYTQAIDRVRTTMRTPDSDIPFSWTPVMTEAAGGGNHVALSLAFRMDSLVFLLGDGGFATDMAVALRVSRDGEVVATGGNRIEIQVPEADMDARREEIVRHEVPIDGSLDAGTYELRVELVDALLGYRTLYTGELVVGD